tara:strand:- start:20 stop:337 length:318 start_codon:yes stop_codon:yes gene_type:complete
MNKNLFTYLIILLLIPIFGVNFIIHLIGNIFLLLVLIPILLILIAFLAFNFFKSNTQICSNCGLTMIGNNEKCLYCESPLSNNENEDISKKASERTIEVKAEEIK